jgi:hypothetical protein
MSCLYSSPELKALDWCCEVRGATKAHLMHRVAMLLQTLTLSLTVAFSKDAFPIACVYR